MKTILVDDDPIGMEGFEIECESLPDVEIVGKFTSPIAALEFAKNNPVDFALLDIDMPEMNGFELYDRLKEIRGDIIVIFVTAHSGYAIEAIRKKADYIVFKPYDKEEIEDVIKRIRLLKARLKRRVECHTFGRFNVFIDGEPVIFKSAKAREILALCVYRRGAPVSAEEIIDKLWPDYSGTAGECSVFRFTVKQLVDTLKKHEAEMIFGRGKGICYIHRDLLSCDYYDFLNDDRDAVCSFQGEFMSEYSWAEGGVYALLERKNLAH